MIRITKTLFVLALLFSVTTLVNAQSTISGTLQDAITLNVLEGVIVAIEDGTQSTVTDDKGNFVLNNVDGTQVTLVFTSNFEEISTQVVELNGATTDLGIIKIDKGDIIFDESDIPTVVLGESELDGGTNTGQDISGILTASRDRFINTAAFGFGVARFRIRGYDNLNSNVYLNGVPINDLENGRAYFGQFGGLNDVMRGREISNGLSALSYAYGGLGGGTNIDTRASNQRKQIRASYAVSNRSYTNRVMLTYNTGMLKNGWAFSFSGSKRWAEEGYNPGSSYDAYSYFAAVDKKYGNHLTSLVFQGSPSKRGKGGTAVQELKDLAGTNYYNPYWGYQNGEKRNSRMGISHQPMVFLQHEWNINKNSSLSGTINYQWGRNGGTALNWFNARDPRPDYYQRLPSYIEDPEMSDIVGNALSTNESSRQLNWDLFYNSNRNNPFGEYEANLLGTNLDGETGNWSQYIIEERRYDTKIANANIVTTNVINDNVTLTGGVRYTHYTQNNFKVLNDLLGGDFWIDINRFAVGDENPDAMQYNLDNPNRLVREGDAFEYDYDANIRKGLAWLQGQFTTRKFDFFAAGNVSTTSFWRTGNFKNGFFPDTSLGDSEKQNFTNFDMKGGVTYKIDGRNYLYVNGAYGTRAPFFRNSFVAARKRNDLVPNLQSETIQTIEGGYLMKSPNLKVRATGYYTEFKDQTKIVFAFSEFLLRRDDFASVIMSGIDQRHTGIELALEGKVLPGLNAYGVASMGQYIYTSRPSLYVGLDEAAGFIIEDETIYQKNYYVGGTPQNAFALGLSYNSPKFWFANLSVNYFNNAWLDFNPLRRTAKGIDGVEKDSESWDAILDQEQLPAAFTVDFFGGKSVRLKNNLFIYLNVGVNNILDNQELITGGYEQLRFDFETKDPSRFPPRYYFAYGRNYFVSLTVKL